MNDPLPPESALRALEFARGEWLNTPQPLTFRDLRGRAVLVHVWDYTSLPSLRALPYVHHWHDRYAAHGLTVVGVHAPCFSFGRERQQVEAAARELGVRYPVLLDNEFRTWHALQAQVWPARYLFDADGVLRFHDVSDGGYAECERAIQALLREMDSGVELPPILMAGRAEPEDCRPVSELRAGFEHGGLGNPEGYAGHLTMIYRLPRQRPAGAFYVEGAWQAGREHLAYQGQTEGTIHLPYEAADVYAVLSPHADAVERILHPLVVSVEVYQDDGPLADDRRGADLTPEGRVVVDRPRTYHLVRNPGCERHALTLRLHSRGASVYAFAFAG